MVHSKNAIGKGLGIKAETSYFSNFEIISFSPKHCSHKTSMSDLFGIFG